MVNEWTRDDLPGIHSPGIHGHEGRQGADAALDAVVAHLNERHPKPCVNRVLVAGQSPAWVFRALEDDHQQALAKVERERDAAVARADQLRDERDDAVQSCMAVGRERDEWRARAEAAEARTAPTVTRDEIEKVVRGQWGECLDGLTDAVWSLLSGGDPAVFVVRESELPDVERDEDGHWLCEKVLVVNGKDTAEDLRGRALPQLKHIAMREAVARAIEAEQAVDPVEAKARELYEHVYVGRFEDGSSGVQTEYRKLAAYLIGQEDRHVDR